MRQNCDARLLGELLDQHGLALELYASQWTTTPEDCVQEALVELAKQCPVPAQPLSWLYRVVRNRAFNAARATRRRAHHERIAAWLTERRELDRLDHADRLAVISAMQALTAAEGELVVLRIWSALTWGEIGRLTETSASSAQRRYVAALKKMRTFLEPPCPTSLKYPKN